MATRRSKIENNQIQQRLIPYIGTYHGFSNSSEYELTIGFDSCSYKYIVEGEIFSISLPDIIYEITGEDEFGLYSRFLFDDKHFILCFAKSSDFFNIKYFKPGCFGCILIGPDGFSPQRVFGKVGVTLDESVEKGKFLEEMERLPC